MNDNLFPSVKKSIQDFINDEEAAIPRGKLLAVGSIMVVLSVILSVDAAAKHTSHKSHSSHSSTSHHRSHVSHTSHSSHSNTHSSHASHSNTHSSHSSHSSTAVTTTKPAVTTATQPVETTIATPSVNSIPIPSDISSINSVEISSNSIAAKLNSIGVPAETADTSELTMALSMPLPTPEFTADSIEVQTPLDPPKVEKN